MYKKLLFLLIFFSCQLDSNSNETQIIQNDWNVTNILSEMNKSWSVGNGCEENNFKIAKNYGMLELCGNTLEIMDCRIQVVDGWVTNFGKRVDVNNTLQIIYRCENSKIVVYEPSLSD